MRCGQKRKRVIDIKYTYFISKQFYYFVKVSVYRGYCIYDTTSLY